MTPYQRIMRNAVKGIGVRLSADEVAALAMDTAIEQRAELDDANDEGASDSEAIGRCPNCDPHLCTCHLTK